MDSYQRLLSVRNNQITAPRVMTCPERPQMVVCLGHGGREDRYSAVKQEFENGSSVLVVFSQEEVNKVGHIAWGGFLFCCLTWTVFRPGQTHEGMRVRLTVWISVRS